MSLRHAAADGARRCWEHGAGDRYVVVIPRAVGNDRDGFRVAHEAYAPAQGSVSAAKRVGFGLAGSDDFNIGVMRDGSLVAVLWMDEVVDDDPGLMAEIATECGP